MGKITAPCSRCLTRTFQVVLHSEDRKDAWDDDEKYEVLECSGCGRVSFARRLLMFDHDEDKQIEEVDYFPAPVSRGLPAWVMKLPADLEDLVLEIYQVVWSGQHRLALMGIRALLEQVMVSKVGDQGRFARNLDAFFEEGFISRVQRDAMSAILDAGHASIHRMYKPTEEDLTVKTIWSPTSGKGIASSFGVKAKTGGRWSWDNSVKLPGFDVRRRCEWAPHSRSFHLTMPASGG